jgi:hypothetical protein
MSEAKLRNDILNEKVNRIREERERQEQEEEANNIKN